jgi:pyruvate/2-oxoglutarate dehydrogenase complex dihydrolipoamide acyltransferase (E2) component
MGANEPVGRVERTGNTADGEQEQREYLCLTGSFDHNVVDGAPAARFMNQLLEKIRRGECVRRTDD